MKVAGILGAIAVLYGFDHGETPKNDCMQAMSTSVPKCASLLSLGGTARIGGQAWRTESDIESMRACQHTHSVERVRLG